jgi:hypothetical protein
MVKDETRFRREAELELKRQKKLARDLWTVERFAHVKRSGPGFSRYTDKSSLHNVAIATERALNGGAVWSDIVDAIRIVAADPQKSPWTIFDAALEQMARREQMLLQAAKLQRERAARLHRLDGLYPIGGVIDQIVSNLKPDDKA